jgi:hypothetical protein
VNGLPSKAPSLLRYLLPVVILMTVFPGAFGALYTRTWLDERQGKGIDQQRASIKGVPWFKPEFRGLVKRLKEHLPEGTGILVEPHAVDEKEAQPGGRTRWFLYLNYYAYPLRIYAYEPKLASGTLVDYTPWIDHHFEALNIDNSLQGMSASIKRDRLLKDADKQIAKRDIEWRLTYPISQSFRMENVKLYHREDGAWAPVAIPAFAALADSIFAANEAGL